MRPDAVEISPDAVMTSTEQTLDGSQIVRWLLRARSLAGATAGFVDSTDIVVAPTGELGSDVARTLGAGCAAIESLPIDAGADQVLAAGARGALLGAHGQAGLVLAHFLRGVADAVVRQSHITPALLALSFAAGQVEAAQAAQGERAAALLTIAQRSVNAAQRATGADMAAVVRAMLEETQQALLDTVGRGPQQSAPITDEHVAIGATADPGGLSYLLVLNALDSVVQQLPAPDPAALIARWQPPIALVPQDLMVLAHAPGVGLAQEYRACGWTTWSTGGAPAVAVAIEQARSMISDDGVLVILPNHSEMVRIAGQRCSAMGDPRVRLLSSHGHAQGIMAARTWSRDQLAHRPQQAPDLLQQAIDATHEVAVLDDIEPTHLPRIVAEHTETLLESGPESVTLATVILGRDCPRPVGRLLRTQLRDRLPHTEVDLIDGGQSDSLVVLSVS